MLLARAGNGMLTLTAVATAVKFGVDISSLRDFFGIPEQFRPWLGAGDGGEPLPAAP